MITAINHGTVIDTVNRTSSRLNIKIEDGKITALSTEIFHGDVEIDAGGLYVSPGFIDAHGHVDGHLYAGELSACQGITTTVGGNCGLSPVDMKAFFEKQEEEGFYIHQAECVGHTFSLRQAVGISDEYRPATASETAEMCRLAELALQEGACGVSLGLDYAPGSSMEEAERLCALSAHYQRICPVHTRLFTEHDLFSLYEAFHLAKHSGVRLLLSHFVYQYCAAGVRIALPLVDKARRDGLDVWMDSGMYTNWTTYLGTSTFDYQTIRDNEMHLSDMIIASGEHYGERLNQELYWKLRHDSPETPIIYCEGKPQDAYDCLLKSYACPSTDIGAYGVGEGHPQIAGTFPKYLKEMVKEQKLLSLEEAVYKATLLPATIFGFSEKGVIAPGMDADLVLFDLEQLQDKAAFPDSRTLEARPDTKPAGIPYVLVRGGLAVDKGKFTGLRNGKIRRKA